MRTHRRAVPPPPARPAPRDGLVDEVVALVSIAAHEIRGPATSIHLAVQSLLEDDGTPPATAKMLGVIERADRRLLRLLDVLMDVGRIRAGCMTVELEELDLGDAVAEVIARMAADVHHSGCRVTLRRGLELTGRWDRFRVDQIVANLVGNALKFGRGRPVEIEVAASEQRARLVVRDHGAGIAAADLHRIFRPFDRGHAARGTGVGLGLYIVRSCAEAMGGSVSATRPADGGSRFTVLLPRHPHRER